MKKQTVTKWLAIFAFLGCSTFGLASCFMERPNASNSDYKQSEETGNSDNSQSEEETDDTSSGGNDEDISELIPSEGLEYALSDDGKSYKVTGTGICVDTDIVIPATYEGLPVTAIAGGYSAGAFFEYTALTSITIPDSVITIEDYAFEGCSSLSSVALGDGITTIGDNSFLECYSLTDINIPNSIKEIGYRAFYKCASLKYSTYENGKYLGNKNNEYVALISVNSKTLTTYKIHERTKILYPYVFEECDNLVALTIPDSVVTIAPGAFARCDRIASITLGNSVESIGYAAFANCKALKNVVIPNSVKIIDYSAFDSCYSLTSIDLGDSLEVLGAAAFNGCTSLTMISIPDTIKEVGLHAFSYADSLTYNTYKNGKYLGNESNPYVVLMDTVSDTATSFEFAENTRVIYQYAFYNTDILTLQMPNTVQYIGLGAFQYSDLESITLSNSLNTIPKYAFQSCQNLKNINIPASIMTIGEDAFANCYSLKNVYITDMEAWCNIDFYDKESHPLSGNANLYLNDTLMAELTLPSSVTAVKNGAFYGYNGLTKLVIHDDITSIDDNAFEYCVNLESITFGNGIEVIGKYAFRGCSALKELTIPVSVKKIESYAFVGCEGLTEITFQGTIAQWEKIEKASDWLDGYMERTNVTKIVCSDGEVSL